MDNKAESKTAEQTKAEHERCDQVINAALKQSTLKAYYYFITYFG